MACARRVCNAVVVVLLVLWSMDGRTQTHGYFPNPARDVAAQDVSILQLIAEPQKYDGKLVRFVGFLRLEVEGNAIYLHREDFLYGITKNGLWVDIPSDMAKQQKASVNMNYVLCVGVFVASEHGHMGMYSGAISDVRRLQIYAVQRDSAGKMPLPPR